MGKFTVKEGKTGWTFNLVAGNGQVIGTSEVYESEKACHNGVAAVKRAAAAANIEDQTIGEAAKNPKFEIYTDKRGEFRFRLKASNGEIVLASEGYKEKASAKNGIESVKKNAADGEIA
jgi:uncharacterized protein YegP (UPF0339 family)